MAHNTLKSSYQKLTERLNRFPQGAPPSELLYAILRVLFSDKEAALVSLLPIKPFDAEKAASVWRVGESEARKILDELAGRAILIDIRRDDGTTIYCLPPPMAGFFEFSLMRIRNDIDQKVLSELFYQYMNVEEDFIKALFADGITQLGRIFVQEPYLPKTPSLEVLDYELASGVIKSASHIGVGICYCRHKMSHVGRACDAPMDICMTFNSTAASLVKYGHARGIDATECMGLLDKAYGHNLVQFGENVQKKVAFICNCCGCCCEALLAQRRFGSLHPIQTSGFIADVQANLCSGCGKCVNACPIAAAALVTARDPRKPERRIAKILEDCCLGCGVCARACATGALAMKKRPRKIISPVTSTHRVVLMAIERGKLQNLIFDNRVLFSHRALAAILGVILKLPPVKRLMASEQMRSRYLVSLLERLKL